MIRSLLHLVAAGFAASLVAFTAHASAACHPGKIDVGGYGIWMNVQGQGRPVVVFESGGGDDATVWQGIEPQVRAMGVTTVVYDRAGLGHSDPNPAPYRIDEEAHALETALNRCKVTGPMILVAHSYGGFVTTLVAADDPQVKGVVFVDANMPAYFNEAEVARIHAQYSPQFDALRKNAPGIAKVLIPIMEAYGDTAHRMREVAFPATVPVIDIVAENSWAGTPEEAAAMRKAHADFVAAAAPREAVFAAGSSHYVMRDKPELVVGAIKRMIVRVRPESASMKLSSLPDRTGKGL